MTSGYVTDVAAYLRDVTADPALVRQAIGRLDEEDMHKYGFQPCYLNMLSLFGERWSTPHVRNVALECMKRRLWNGWAYSVYSATLVTKLRALTVGANHIQVAETALAGWNADLLSSLLAAGRGLIVCGFHFGSYRYIPTDLFLSGFKVSYAVDSRVVSRDSLAVETWRNDYGSRVRLVYVDQPIGVVSLLKALGRGEIVYINVDGNRGVDGPHGGTSRATVGFAGMRIRVKTGVARMAALSNSPLLPAIALPDGDAAGTVRFGTPILPPRGQTDSAHTSDDQTFAHSATQDLYTFLERHALEHPEEWSEIRFLHRWRQRGLSGGLSSPTPNELGAVRAHLASGGAYRFNEQRVAPVGHRDDPVYLDVHTLYGLESRVIPPALLRALASSQGLDEARLCSVCDEGSDREQLVVLLATLAANTLVVECRSPNERIVCSKPMVVPQC